MLRLKEQGLVNTMSDQLFLKVPFCFPEAVQR